MKFFLTIDGWFYDVLTVVGSTLQDDPGWLPKDFVYY